MRRTGLLLALATSVLLLGGCEPARTEIAMRDNLFDPATATVARGSTVRWTNEGSRRHSSTSDGPGSFWSSGTFSGGGSYERAFAAGGTFAYHCTLHSNMKGSVIVPIAASPASGPSGTTFTITLASAPAASGFDHVVQVQPPGGSFGTLRAVTAAKTTVVLEGPGTYRFRSQLRRTSTGATSGFSPTVAVNVTAG